MRGRTLKNAFVIIDEAQNTTVPQMKMVLTRLGRGSRMVVTGDPSQTDLPSNTQVRTCPRSRSSRASRASALEELTRARTSSVTNSSDASSTPTTRTQRRAHRESERSLKIA